MSHKENLRTLFSNHAVYTKFFIESALQSLPDTGVVTNFLMDNQVQIGNYLKPYIGDANGTKLTELLQKHISAAAGAVNALKNNTPTQEAVSNVFAVSAQVANFLHSLNPSQLPLKQVTDMFKQHNQYVIDMAINHIKGKYQEEYNLFNKYYMQIMAFSDLIAHATEVYNSIQSYSSLSLIIIVLLVFLFYYYNQRNFNNMF